jgi:hypothetical protein
VFWFQFVELVCADARNEVDPYSDLIGDVCILGDDRRCNDVLKPVVEPLGHCPHLTGLADLAVVAFSFEPTNSADNVTFVLSFDMSPIRLAVIL